MALVNQSLIPLNLDTPQIKYKPVNQFRAVYRSLNVWNNWVLWSSSRFFQISQEGQFREELHLDHKRQSDLHLQPRAWSASSPNNKLFMDPQKLW